MKERAKKQIRKQIWVLEKKRKEWEKARSASSARSEHCDEQIADIDSDLAALNELLKDK